MSPSRDSIRAWPFLVARGRHAGYRTLLAPAFLIDDDLHETLSDATPTVEVGSLGRVALEPSGVGSLGLTYTTEDLSESSRGAVTVTGTWTDEHGRPLEILYGVVAREPLSPTLTVADLQGAREEALRAYRRFLTDEDGFAVCRSQSYLLPGSPAASAAAASRPPQRARNERRDPAPRPPRRTQMALRMPRPALASVAIAAVIAALVISLPGAAQPARPIVTIVSATATPLTGDPCSATGEVRLQARVATNRPVGLAYRWVPAGTPGPQSDETIKAGARPVTISVIRPAGSGPYRLVIDKPVRRERGPVQCQPPIGADGSSGAPLTP